MVLSPECPPRLWRLTMRMRFGHVWILAFWFSPRSRTPCTRHKRMSCPSSGSYLKSGRIPEPWRCGSHLSVLKKLQLLTHTCPVLDADGSSGTVRAPVHRLLCLARLLPPPSDYHGASSKTPPEHPCLGRSSFLSASHLLCSTWHRPGLAPPLDLSLRVPPVLLGTLYGTR